MCLYVPAYETCTKWSCVAVTDCSGEFRVCRTVWGVCISRSERPFCSSLGLWFPKCSPMVPCALAQAVPWAFPWLPLRWSEQIVLIACIMRFPLDLFSLLSDSFLYLCQLPLSVYSPSVSFPLSVYSLGLLCGFLFTLTAFIQSMLSKVLTTSVIGM